MSKLERYDRIGGRLEAEVIGGTIAITLRNTSTLGQIVHLLHGPEDAVGIAHWLLRNAYELGDRRPEVAAALGTLEELGIREEAQQQ